MLYGLKLFVELEEIHDKVYNKDKIYSFAEVKAARERQKEIKQKLIQLINCY